MMFLRSARYAQKSLLFCFLPAPSSFFMGKQGRKGSKQTALTGSGVWTSIGVNYSTYKPTDEEILARYLLKFSKGGKTTAAELHQDDLGLLDPSGDSEGYLVQAASGAIEL